ncbi:MAG: hypothetical protein JWN00_701 [Actinomycetia bacterium]|nr:hypothetical protein [Actinomycetes bacterium]
MSEPGAQLDLNPVLDELIDWRFKSFPALAEPVPIRSVPSQAWNVLAGDFVLPSLVLKERPLQHNIELMAQYCRDRGVSLAPHAKTPVAPQLARLQLAAGAWGLTVATTHQARVFRSLGASRLLLANEIADRASVAWMAAELSRDPDFELFCLVDSIAGAALLDAHLRDVGFRGRVPVLIELGVAGGRCGCRTPDDALQLARALTTLPRLELAGVETYENMFPAASQDQTVERVDDLLDAVRTLVAELDEQGAFADRSEVLVTAGGSIWFDRVVARLAGDWHLTRPVRTVLRSGSYVTHDAAQYEELSPLAGRAACGEDRLAQALELWGVVLSRPEAELAILNFGKRDAAHDRGFPLPFTARTAAGELALSADTYEILSLNDQHARLRVPSASTLRPGDLVGCHISHPCTSFDNWRLIPLVDDQYNVLDAIRSYL